jgi:hypothetical protein
MSMPAATIKLKSDRLNQFACLTIVDHASKLEFDHPLVCFLR